MSLLDKMPEKSGRRLAKVLVRSLHLVGVAGVFGSALAAAGDSVYISLVVGSGFLLVLMEISSNLLWLVQLRGLSIYLKLVLLLVMHLSPAHAIPCLISMILISGFFSHAPCWIRYYSLQHRMVVKSPGDLLG